jgi:hypothetical protein
MCAVKDDQSAVLDREPDQDKSHAPPAPASAARSAAGRHGRMTVGRVAAATYGIHLTPGEFVPPVFTSGLQPSASRVSAGRRNRIGMRSSGGFHPMFQS